MMATNTMKARPQGMSYKAYRAACKAKGQSPMDEDTWKALPMEGEEEDNAGDGAAPAAAAEPATDADAEPGDDEDGAEKSEAGKSDLQKSLDALDDVLAATDATGGGQSREAYLQARLDAGTISKSERAELGRIWAGDNATEDGGGEPVRKSLVEYLDDDDHKVVDAVPMLKGAFKGVDDTLSRVEKAVAADGRATRQLLKGMAGVLRQQGSVIEAQNDRLQRQDRVIKALEERLGLVERTPAPRRAVTTPAKAGQVRPIAKSAGGNGSDGSETPYGGLTKSQVSAGLRALVKGAHDERDDDTVARFSDATALFSTTGRISKGDLAAVRMVVEQ